MADEPIYAMRGFDRSLPMVLLQARETAMGMFRPMLGENDLTEQQWRVLRALASTDSAMDAGELADTTFLLAPSLSRILSALETRSLITRETPEHDRRRSMISLSASGREVVTNIAPQSEAIYEELEERFGTERLDGLIAELKALSDIGPAMTQRETRRRRTPPVPSSQSPSTN